MRSITLLILFTSVSTFSQKPNKVDSKRYSDSEIVFQDTLFQNNFQPVRQEFNEYRNSVNDSSFIVYWYKNTGFSSFQKHVFQLNEKNDSLEIYDVLKKKRVLVPLKKKFLSKSNYEATKACNIISLLTSNDLGLYYKQFDHYGCWRSEYCEVKSTFSIYKNGEELYSIYALGTPMVFIDDAKIESYPNNKFNSLMSSLIFLTAAD